ncbi:hypothetical protein HK096_002101 [Nowakowskiella sp. JEL0078]|nr:hypothetical protein HK096_002101 [Nowakowskiella sp. JEL0078]
MLIHDILSKSDTVVLDVGCGPGSWSRDVAMKYPKTTVHAVDLSNTVSTKVEKLTNVIFTSANVLKRLPYPDNYFDAVYQRFLISGIPGDRWDDVILELQRVTKPGGFIELVEFDEAQQLGPIGKILIGETFQAHRLRGIDMEFASKMKNRMESLGLEIQSEIIRSLPIGWKGKIGEINARNFAMLMVSCKPMMMKSLEVKSETYDKMVEDMLLEFPKYQAFTNIYAVVAKKPEVQISMIEPFPSQNSNDVHENLYFDVDKEATDY